MRQHRPQPTESLAWRSRTPETAKPETERIVLPSFTPCALAIASASFARRAAPVRRVGGLGRFWALHGAPPPPGGSTGRRCKSARPRGRWVGTRPTSVVRHGRAAPDRRVGVQHLFEALYGTTPPPAVLLVTLQSARPRGVRRTRKQSSGLFSRRTPEHACKGKSEKPANFGVIW